MDKKDDKALALILLSVEEGQLSHVKKAKTSREAWENLRRIHESRGSVRRAALYKQLLRMKKKTSQTMTQYINDQIPTQGRTVRRSSYKHP